ncbi:MAG: 23S rRNA (uracil(1939)-C(5))-methyltransferase RlmD [Terriglobales bacterium]
MQLTIEKLVYGGDGLARGPAGEGGGGKAVFVPFVLAGERVEASVVQDKAGFVRAAVQQILESSPERISAGCPYFSHCGGCQYQHTNYEHQLQIKTAILRESMQRLGQIEAPAITVHDSPPWHYRNRTRMRVRAGVNFALGYQRMSSRQLVPVEQCPISSPLINRAIESVWQLGRAQMVNAALSEIEFFANAADDRLLVEFTLADNYWALDQKPGLVEFVAELRRLLPEVAGVAVFRMTPKGPVVREDIPPDVQEIFGADELSYDAGGCEYHVSAGSFFQANRYLIGKLIELVTSGQTGDSALDLYAGTGLFGLPLSQSFREVIAVEAASFSFHDLRRNTPSNVAALRETAESFLERTCKRRTTAFDLVVVDPPRAGLGAEVIAGLDRLPTAHITYVSCDPATLARDIKLLSKAGFKVREMHLLDLFPQTFHIETVARLAR